LARDHTTSGSNIEENLLGLNTKEAINLAEAQGVAEAEESLLHYDADTRIDTYLILEIHKTAFDHLYEWAGKLRCVDVTVGNFTPPPYSKIPNLMAEFSDQLLYLVDSIKKCK
jgi:cell filamentation protein